MIDHEHLRRGGDREHEKERSERYGDGEIIAYHGGWGWKTGGAQPGGGEERWIARERGAELLLLCVAAC